jgi:hypothetical protein
LNASRPKGETSARLAAVAAKRRAALGFKVRTGRAIVVALGGPSVSPEILAKTRIDVALRFEEGAVFHVAQERPIDEARAFVRDAETRFVQRARTELAALAGRLDARVVAAGMVAGAVKRLPPLETILKSHPLVHAAEGELYRRVFGEAGAALGMPPARVPEEELAERTAAALGLSEAKLAEQLAALGKASGRPWAADHKEAALVAWLALAGA